MQVGQIIQFTNVVRNADGTLRFDRRAGTNARGVMNDVELDMGDDESVEPALPKAA
jgi:hypothetical protein